MAQDHLIFHTNDRVVTSTSLGNQEKWFDAEKTLWYKVDNGHFEALAEFLWHTIGSIQPACMVCRRCFRLVRTSRQATKA